MRTGGGFQLRRGYVIVAIVTTVVFRAGSARAQEKVVPTTSPQAQPQRKGRMLDLPRAIDRAEWESYCHILTLSDGQLAYLAPEFDKYVAEQARIRSDATPKARELGYASVEARGRGVEFESAVDNEFRAAVRAIREELFASDQRLFGAVRVLLAESQLPLLDRVQNQRLRDCRTREYATIGRSEIDLVDLVPRALGDQPLSEAALAILEEYDATITPMVVRLDAERVRIMPSIIRLEIMLHTSRPEETLEERVRLREERVAYLSKLGRREDRLADRNEQFLERLCSALPAEAARLCQDQFDMIAYRNLLPDPCRPDTLLRHVLSNSQLPHDTLAATNELAATHAAATRPLVREVRELHAEWKLDLASTMSSRGLQEYQAGVVQVLGRMCDLNEQLVDQVLAILPAEMSASLTQEVSAWRASLAERRQQLAAGNFPPP